MDVPMGTEDNFIEGTKAAVKEREITSDSSVRSGRADPTPSDSSGGGDGSGAPCPWSLTQEQHVRNLKENLRRVLGDSRSELLWPDLEVDPWFARVVAQMTADPCLDYSKLEIKEGHHIMKGVRPLQLAVLMEDLEMVQKILETCLGQNTIDNDFKIQLYQYFKYSALDLAIVCVENEIVDALLEKNVKVYTSQVGSLQLAVAYSCAKKIEKICKIIQSLVRQDINITVKDRRGYSTFYIAVVAGETNIVKELLKLKDKIQLNEGCNGGPPPIQIAYEEGFKDMESTLMQCDDVRKYIELAFRD